MKEMDEIYRNLENLEGDALKEFAAEKFENARAALNEITEDDHQSTVILTTCAMAAVYVDGKFTEEEYDNIADLIYAASDIRVSYEEAKYIIEIKATDEASNEKLIDETLSNILDIDARAGADFILFLAAMCCADGDACWKERLWLQKAFN